MHCILRLICGSKSGSTNPLNFPTESDFGGGSWFCLLKICLHLFCHIKLLDENLFWFDYVSCYSASVSITWQNMQIIMDFLSKQGRRGENAIFHNRKFKTGFPTLVLPIYSFAHLDPMPIVSRSQQRIQWTQFPNYNSVFKLTGNILDSTSNLSKVGCWWSLKWDDANIQIGRVKI